MVKFVDRVDHVQWVCHAENIEANVQLLSRIFDCELMGPVQKDELGFTVYVDWSSGLEVIAPMEKVTDFNRQFHDHLAAHGEGVQSIIFGVKGIEEHRKRVLALGHAVGETFGDDPNSPWAGQLELSECIVGTKVMNTQLVFGEIRYADGLVRVE